MNETPALLTYTAVHSRLLGRSLKCWVFALED
jgi:hypothetical protein